ncbi:hypothetical protein B7L68_07135 [Thermoproteus sp. CP80]|uniref:hypothetical protein n=1 Tax=Thermoproteus sp. CP80 TaxID=1650659 RepID=UPI0009BEA79D|nr:hypothetical protein [Thermoproteus sp. CP80]PLC62671.1 hypothetical protein B7L68_07135 [Thermoproteus sp. CP80]
MRSRLTWLFRKLEILALLFVLGLLYVYFKSKVGYLDQMKTSVFLVLVVPLLIYLSVEDAVKRAPTAARRRP